MRLLLPFLIFFTLTSIGLHGQAHTNGFPPNGIYPPDGENSYRCGTGTSGVYANPGDGGDQVRWYSTATGGTSLGTGTAYLTPSISVSVTYYAETYNSSTNQFSSTRTAITAVVLSMPAAPSALTATPLTCASSAFQLSGTPGTNGTDLNWYAASSGGTPLSTLTAYTTSAISSNTIYYAETYNTHSPTTCKSTTRTAITATIVASPSAPSLVLPASGIATACSGTNVTLQANAAGGDKIVWTNTEGMTATVATGAAYTFAPLSTSVYSAQSYNSALHCTSAGAVSVNVYMNLIPQTGANDDVIYGSGTANLSVIVPPGFTAQWYADNTSSTILSTDNTFVTPVLYSTKAYYVALKDVTNNCINDRTAIFANVISAISPSNVTTEIIRVPGQTSEATLNSLNTTTQKSVSITMIDGLGRPFQSILKNVSPTNKDIVQPIEYDSYGRASKSYLPYTAATAGGFQQNYRPDQNKFYNASGDKIANDINPYALARYEASPLGRVVEQGNYGQDWQPATGATQGSVIVLPSYQSVNNYNATTSISLEHGFDFAATSAGASMHLTVGGPTGVSHTKTMAYSYNTGASTDTDDESIRLFASDGTSSGYYAANTLSETTITDENGNKEIIFKDKTGNVIARKQQLNGTINSVTVSYLETYYIYDEFSRLKFIITPTGVSQLKQNAWSLNATILDRQVHQFVYDNRGRITSKKTPGQTWNYYAYDRFNRLVLVQDGNLRPLNKWAFTKYDYYGRVVMSGFYTNTTQIGVAAIQSVLNGQYASPSNPYYETKGTTLHGYTNVSWPTIGTGSVALEIMSVAYYDNYDFDFSGTDDFTYTAQGLSGEAVQASAFLKPTGNKRAIIGNTTWLYNYVFYDKNGRAIQTRSNNHLSTTVDNLATMSYDFEGKLISTKTYHKAAVGKEITQTTTPLYDNMGRTTSIRQSSGRPLTATGNIPVTWDAATGVVINNNIVTRTASGTGWTAGAYSHEAIPANTTGTIEFNAGQNSVVNQIMGFSTSFTGYSYSNVGYGILTTTAYYVYEAGAIKFSGGAFAVTDKFKIQRSGGTITYYKNGTLIYTSTANVTGALHAQFNINNQNGIWRNINMSLGPWTNQVNVTATGASLSKTSGTDATWNAGAFSTQTIPSGSGGYVEFSPGQTNTYKAVGLSATDGDLAIGTINYALNAAGDGNLYTVESGAQSASYGSYLTTDVLRVERQGTTILYKKNATVIATSSVPSTADLHGDLSFYNLNATVNNVSMGVDQKLSSYEYNELNQLVDKKLYSTAGTQLQSVDYRYNIQGRLSSINNAQLTNDGDINTDSIQNDYFGQEFLYNVVDPTLGNTGYYNGNVSATKWKAIGTAAGVTGEKSYKFQYDKADKLLSATYQKYGTSAWDQERNMLNESMTYDHNGNILTLRRNQNFRNGAGVVSAQAIDVLTYTYALGNRLTKVEDSVATSVGFGDFKNGVSVTKEYTYDTAGNVTSDLNKGISSIVYNVIGKPQSITFSDGRVVNYAYDAAGTKLRMTTINGTTNTTDYINGFVYQNSTLDFFSSPEGRVLNNKGNLEYQFAVADNQGNTRVVFTSATPTATSMTASLEGDAADNTVQFEQVSGVVVAPVAIASGTNTKVVRMNQANPIALSKSLKVYPGDKVDLSVYSYYTGTGFGTSNVGATTFITALAAAFGGVSGGVGEGGSIYSGVNNAITGAGMGSSPSDAVPSAYLNYILFDQNYSVVDMGWTPATGNFSTKMTIPTVNVKEAGYIFVYLSYEDAANAYVYFDNMNVTYTPGNIIQSNEYYPFGLQSKNSWTRDNTSNNFLYDEGSEVNTATGWYDLPYRNYDPSLGRFFQIDPLAMLAFNLSPYHYGGNNPMTSNDPSGARMETPGEIGRSTPGILGNYQDGWTGWGLSFGAAGGPDGGGGGGGYGGPGAGYYRDEDNNLVYSDGFGQTFIQTAHYKDWYKLYGDGTLEYDDTQFLGYSWTPTTDPTNKPEILHASSSWDWFLQTTKLTSGNKKFTVKTAVFIFYNTDDKDWGTPRYGKVRSVVIVNQVKDQFGETDRTDSDQSHVSPEMDQLIKDAKDYHCGGCNTAPTVFDKYVDFALSPSKPRINRLNDAGGSHR